MDNEIKCKIFELIDTGMEALNYIEEYICKNENEKASNMLKNVEILIENLKISLKHLKAEKSILYCENLISSIKKTNCNENSMVNIFNYEIKSLFLELKTTMEFDLISSTSSKKILEYRKNREARIREYAINGAKDAKFEVTIVLIAYNNIEYTKKAIESIYRNTDFSNNKVELITLNNGSTDGTEEYFKSLPNEKKINLKFNILGNEIYKHLVEGKYFVGFSNDVVATPRWLENLIKCIESDEKIFWVVPTCNEDGISNNQGVKIDYENSLNSIDKIYDFGDKYNFSNRLLWEERNILMPFIWLGRSRIFEYFDLVDKSYLKHEFVDDDLSTSLRRLGLKQILAKDTFMHHFGSVTLKDERKNGSLENMREVYFKKWGVDAWDSRGYIPNIEYTIENQYFKEAASVLFIEPKFGMNALGVLNYFKKNNLEIINKVAVVCDSRYLPDAEFMYDKIIETDNLNNYVKNEKQKFNFITFGCCINELVKDIIPFLEKLYDLLNDEGQIVFAIKNYRNTKVILDMLKNNFSSLAKYKDFNFNGINFEGLKSSLQSHSFLWDYHIHAVLIHNNFTDALLNIDINYKNLEKEDQKNLKNNFDTSYYWVSIRKTIK